MQKRGAPNPLNCLALSTRGALCHHVGPQAFIPKLGLAIGWTAALLQNELTMPLMFGTLHA